MPSEKPESPAETFKRLTEESNEKAIQDLRRLTEEAIRALGPDLQASGLVEAYSSMTQALKFLGKRLDPGELRTILRQQEREVPAFPDSVLIVYHPSLLKALRDLRSTILHPAVGGDGLARDPAPALASLRQLCDALALRREPRPGTKGGQPPLQNWQAQDRYWLEAERKDFAAIVDELARAVPSDQRSLKDIQAYLKIERAAQTKRALASHILPWSFFSGKERLERARTDIAHAIFRLRKALREKQPREAALASIATHWQNAKKSAPRKNAEKPHHKRT